MSTSLKAKHQRPEGKLLERAMAGPPKISGRQLAERVKMSEGRIRQIVNGYKTEGGTVIEVSAPADTLARLALELGIDAHALGDAGRADAGEIVAVAGHQARVGVRPDGTFWVSDGSEELAALQDWIEAGDPSKTPPALALQLWDVNDLLDAAKRRWADDVHAMSHLLEKAGIEGPPTDHPNVIEDEPATPEVEI